MRSEVVDFAAGNTDIVEAMIGKAGCLATQLIFGWSESAAEDKKQATELIDSALSKSGGNPRAHTIKGALLLLGHRCRHWLNSMRPSGGRRP